MAAALAGAAEVATFLREFCHSPTPCCEIDPDTKEVNANATPNPFAKTASQITKIDWSARVFLA